MRIVKAVLVWVAMALPLAGQPTAQEVLETARAALGGNKLAAVRSLVVWGPDRRGAQNLMLTLSMDFSGKFLREQTSFSSGGQVPRVGIGEDGAAAASGGMPGDDGGPALVAGSTEGLSGDNYWTRIPGSGRADGNALEPAAAARKRSFIDSCARYALAFTLSAPANFPVSFVYAGRVETPGGTADGLEGIGPGDFQVRLFIDTKTHLPLMMNYRDGGQDVQLWLKDYRPEGGILFPHAVTWVTDGDLTEEFQAQRFRVNPKFRPEKFQK
jgi:hypothetical protein